jgi:hypothetical protein
MNLDQLSADEPLSPESVLVLPPELRVQAIARLGAPSWPTPRTAAPQPVPERVPERRTAHVPKRAAARVPERVAEHVPERVAARVIEYLPESFPEHVAERVPEQPPREEHIFFDPPFLRSLGTIVAGRAVQLGLIFLAVTLVTLAMSVVAHAIR